MTFKEIIAGAARTATVRITIGITIGTLSAMINTAAITAATDIMVDDTGG